MSINLIKNHFTCTFLEKQNIFSINFWKVFIAIFAAQYNAARVKESGLKHAGYFSLSLNGGYTYILTHGCACYY